MWNFESWSIHRESHTRTMYKSIKYDVDYIESVLCKTWYYSTVFLHHNFYHSQHHLLLLDIQYLTKWTALIIKWHPKLVTHLKAIKEECQNYVQHRVKIDWSMQKGITVRYMIIMQEINWKEHCCSTTGKIMYDCKELHVWLYHMAMHFIK